MHFQNSCTSNGDCLILLINTGDAYKVGILSQTVIKSFKKCKGGGIDTKSKLMVAAK